MRRPFPSAVFSAGFFRPAVWVISLMLAWLAVSGATAGNADCGPSLRSRAGLWIVDCGVSNPQSETRPEPSRRVRNLKWNAPLKVTPRLFAELDANGEADILVFVRGRPDLTPARALPAKKARGRFVVDALRATAERTQADSRRLLDARGVDYQAFWIVNMLRVRADRVLVSELAGRPEIEKLDRNLKVRGLAPDAEVKLDPGLAESAAYPWGISAIGAPAVWERGVLGQGIVVAGNDTGVDWGHVALIDSYRGWDGGTPNHSYNWHDAWNKTPLEPTDDAGHGTHTIGTVAGGGTQHIGTAPDARWMACRNMDSGYGTPASYVDCFQFFLAPTDLDGKNPQPDLAPHVINNSWACVESEGCHPDDPLWDDTIRPAVEALTEAGIAVVVSAGNSGLLGCRSVRFPPAIYPQSLGVGATEPGNRITSFSSRGPVTIDGRGIPAPDLAAPGAGVLSSVPGDSYAELSGTSMAAPHVAGAIALLWSAEPRLIGRLAVTEQVLRASATPVADDTCGGDPDGQPNNVYGWGVINADAAVRAAETLQELSGIVTDVAGNPLPDADVRLVDLTWGAEADLLTGPDGHYTSPLLPGDYRVVADTPAHFAASAVVTVPMDGPEAHDVALQACVDWNGDGRTGLFEIQEVAGDWRNAALDSKHDLNGDGVPNILDLAILTAHFDEPCSVPASQE